MKYVFKLIFLCFFANSAACRLVYEKPEAKNSNEPVTNHSSPSKHTELELAKAALDKESESLCLKARQLGESQQVRDIHEDFHNLSKNLHTLDCDLFLEFVYSNEFDTLFADEMKLIKNAGTDRKYSSTSKTKAAYLSENPDNPKNEPTNPTLANPELVPKLLMMMGLFGYVSAARFQFVQKLGKLAFFQFALSTVSLYLSFRTGNNIQTELEQEAIPWVLFLNGVMGAVGSTTVIKNGYSKLKNWEVNPDSGKPLNYKEFRKQYSTLDKGEIDNRQLRKLDDVAITSFAEKHKLDPKTVKGTVSVAIIGVGSIMAAFAIKQLTAGVQELKNNYKLTDADKPRSFEEIFKPGLLKLLLLKNQIRAQMGS